MVFVVYCIIHVVGGGHCLLHVRCMVEGWRPADPEGTVPWSRRGVGMATVMGFGIRRSRALLVLVMSWCMVLWRRGLLVYSLPCFRRGSTMGFCSAVEALASVSAAALGHHSACVAVPYSSSTSGSLLLLGVALASYPSAGRPHAPVSSQEMAHRAQMFLTVPEVFNLGGNFYSYARYCGIGVAVLLVQQPAGV